MPSPTPFVPKSLVTTAFASSIISSAGLPPSPPSIVPHSFNLARRCRRDITNRVLITQTMIAVTLRHPYEVAQAVACLDRISNGRAELGVGAGWLRMEHDAMGLSFGSPSERIIGVVEAIQICRGNVRKLWDVWASKGRCFERIFAATWPETPPCACGHGWSTRTFVSAKKRVAPVRRPH